MENLEAAERIKQATEIKTPEFIRENGWIVPVGWHNIDEVINSKETYINAIWDGKDQELLFLLVEAYFTPIDEYGVIPPLCSDRHNPNKIVTRGTKKKDYDIL